jgi:hypothetical protein
VKTTSLIIGTILLIFSCEKSNLINEYETPLCIRDKIDEIAAGEVWNPPAKIYCYRYNRQTVYYFPSRCCDVPGLLYDENCNVICSPGGGINGEGDGQCPDFFDTRTNEELIWEDTRE